MNDFEPNLPEVVAEVREKFENYERALAEKDVDILDATFWNSPFTVRLAMSEHGYGFDAIHEHRVARPPGPSIKEKRIRLEILTIGHTVATVNLEFKVLGQDLVGRQSQSWVKFPDVGWKVISAHVSTTDGTKLW
jgi:AtzH-like